MWALNLGKPIAVPKLNQGTIIFIQDPLIIFHRHSLSLLAMAIELGANLLGETVIFTIGAAVLIFEYQRSARKEVLKEQLLIQEKMELQATLNELAFQCERYDTQIRELTRVIAEIGE
jgi:hypothetical protein